MRLANTNRVVFGQAVHGSKGNAFLGILGQDEIVPGSFVAGRESVRILENALDLNLDAPALAIADIANLLR